MDQIINILDHYYSYSFYTQFSKDIWYFTATTETNLILCAKEHVENNTEPYNVCNALWYSINLKYDVRQWKVCKCV